MRAHYNADNQAVHSASCEIQQTCIHRNRLSSDQEVYHLQRLTNPSSRTVASVDGRSGSSIRLVPSHRHPTISANSDLHQNFEISPTTLHSTLHTTQSLHAFDRNHVESQENPKVCCCQTDNHPTRLSPEAEPRESHRGTTQGIGPCS
jgi:hypothetical protein